MANILLLETDRQIARNIQQLFKNSGHQLSYYADPQQAVAAADKSRPDIILLDTFLAGRSGIEFLYELRSYPDWQDIPVIITGFLPPDYMQDFPAALQQLKVAAYVPKRDSDFKNLVVQAEKVLRAPVI